MLYEKINRALEARFIKTEKIARAIALAIEAEENVILFGPGGHGKSEMAVCAVEAAGLAPNLFIQVFGTGMAEDRLFGGIDLEAMENTGEIRYKTERSFMAKSVAIFEELFDAPPSVLLSLKDVLTSKCLRNGNQEVPSKCRTIVACTNRSPQEVAELGPSVEALIQRFPLQLVVEWPSYTTNDYTELLRKVAPKLGEAGIATLAGISAKATAEGRFVSPRTVVKASQVLLASARMAGLQVPGSKEFLDLALVNGMESLAENLEKEIQAAKEKAASTDALEKLRKAFNGLIEARKVQEGQKPIACLVRAKQAYFLRDHLAGVRVTDDLVKTRNELQEALIKFAQEEKTMALSLTNAPAIAF